MLDEVASAKTDSNAQAADTAPVQPASGQKAEASTKPFEAAPAATDPAAATTVAKDDTSGAIVSPELDSAPVPLATKVSDPDAPAPQPDAQPGQKADTEKPTPVAAPMESAVALVQPTAGPASPAPAAAVPAQLSPTAEQQPQPSAPEPHAPGLALVAPVARQMAHDIEVAKEDRSPARAGDDQPEAPVPNAEQGRPAQTKPATSSSALQSQQSEAAPRRRDAEFSSDKQAAPQTFDDLVSAANAPSGAAPSSGAAASAATQAASAAPAATATAPGPQAQLAPVPLSGVPVLIAGRALAGDNHFDIRLDPPELGRIEVRLKVARDGEISSHLIADRADTLALLRRDQSGLERALQDAGLKTSNDGLQFSLRDQGGHSQPDSRPGASTLIAQDNSNATSELPRAYTSYTGRVGGIDIHV
jgi:flagellar hook-length control protein FliK